MCCLSACWSASQRSLLSQTPSQSQDRIDLHQAEARRVGAAMSSHPGVSLGRGLCIFGRCAKNVSPALLLIGWAPQRGGWQLPELRPGRRTAQTGRSRIAWRSPSPSRQSGWRRATRAGRNAGAAAPDIAWGHPEILLAARPQDPSRRPNRLAEFRNAPRLIGILLQHPVELPHDRCSVPARALATSTAIPYVEAARPTPDP